MTLKNNMYPQPKVVKKKMYNSTNKTIFVGIYMCVL